MSNSKNRSPYFYSPLKVEADQKDVIIGHLKEEVYHLKKNEQEFYVLEDQYRNLDHKYRLLSEEKAISDANFKDRHDQAIRSVYQLKSDIQVLRADLRKKNEDIDDLECDQNTLVSQLDQRAIEIDKLKHQFSSLVADSDESANERVKLDQSVQGVRRDNQGLNNNIQNLNLNLDGVKRKIEDLDRYLTQLKTEQNLLKDKIISYENQNNGLDSDINSTAEDVAGIESRISNAQAEYTNLQTDTAQVNALSDKYKSQALHYHRATQAETMKNNDLAKILSQTEGTLRVRIGQVDQGSKEVTALNSQNQRIGQSNSQLRQDIEYCRKHLQNIGLLNSDLVCNLEKYSQEDEVVRNLIDRRTRVLKARDRVEQVGAYLVRTSGGEGSIRKSKLIY